MTLGVTPNPETKRLKGVRVEGAVFVFLGSRKNFVLGAGMYGVGGFNTFRIRVASSDP